MSRVQMTEKEFAQLGLFPKPDRPAFKPGAKRIQRRKSELPENIIEGQICGFLKSRGWTVQRNHVGTFAAIGMLMGELSHGRNITKEILFRCMVRIGTKGTADWLVERPRPGSGFGMKQVFWLEVKAPGKKLKPEQAEFIRRRRALGEVAVWFDDFEGMFLPWYEERFGDSGGAHA